MSEITYVFRDSKTYAIREGKVIAASSDPDDVQRQVKQSFGPGPHEDGNESGPFGPPTVPSPHPDDPALVGHEPRCEYCDGTEEECARGGCGPGNFVPAGSVQNPDPGNPMYDQYPHDEPSPGHMMGGEAGPYMAKVMTPNGLRGTVLGKVSGLWGDEVTVRLENGRIVKLPVGTELHTQKTAAAPRVNPIERLEARLAATPDGTRESLVVRSKELESIRKYASTLIRDGVSYADSLRLDQLVITAEVEQTELVDAVAHMDASEPIAAPSFTMSAAHEAAGIHREDASWLDHTLGEMIKEAEAMDFASLMDEGPEALTAELADSALADQDVTRQVASDFIGEKTAGIAREIAEPYMNTFLARVEECRRAEHNSRKTPTQKEAAVEEDKHKDLPDDALFL